MTAPPLQAVDLLELHRLPAVNHLSGFCEFARELNPDSLISGYTRLLDAAPRRHAHGRTYFVGHTGQPASGTHSNRREEHLAIALWNWNHAHGPLELATDYDLDLVDYQFPLKARRADQSVGKVDLLGVLDGRQFCVIELKIHPENRGIADTPLRAFLEALAYCAIVEANAADIAAEVAENPGIHIQHSRPALMVMAPEEYWDGYLDHPRAGDWWPALRHLADQLQPKMGLDCHFISLAGATFNKGVEGQKPRMTGNPRLAQLETFIREKR